MTTDANATYYDLALEATTSDGTRVAATVETRDIVRAVLERAGLGADASHQLGKLLERAIRIGAKPGTDVPREVEKIAIEAGMLRDAVEYARSLEACPERLLPTFKNWHRVRRNAKPAGAAEPITDDDAEDAIRVECEYGRLRRQCQECDANAEIAEMRARIAELERCPGAIGYRCADGELVECDEDGNEEVKSPCPRCRPDEFAAGYRARLDELVQRATHAERERDQWRDAHTELEEQLDDLRDRYRPRRQSEEPAPAGVPVLSWSHSEKRRDIGVWFWRMGENVAPNGTWTHQPPAPEAEREGE